jgi:hypothetical protein
VHLPGPLRIVVKTILRFALVLIFLGIPAAVLVLKFVGFGPDVRDAVSAALSIGKVQTRIERLSFDVVEGVVAEGVELRVESPHPRQIASINRAAVALSLSELLAGRIQIDRVVLHRADAAIPVGASGETMDIASLSAEMHMIGDQLQVSRASGMVEGIRVTAEAVFTGLENPDLPSDEGASPPELLERTLQELSNMEYPEGPPSIHLHAEGDLSDRQSIIVSPVSLRSGPIEGRGWCIEGIAGEARYANGRVEIDQLVIKDSVGSLRVWASADRDGGEAEISGRFLPGPWVEFAAGDANWKDMLNLSAPMEVSVRARVGMGKGKTDIRASGRIATSTYQIKDIHFGPMDAEFAWDNGKAFVRGARLTTSRGEAIVDILYDKDDIRLRAQGWGDPTELAPLVDDKAREMLETMEFQHPARFALELRGAEPDFKKLAGEGTLELGRTAMRGVWIDRASSRLEIGEGAVSYKDFNVEGVGGSGSGTFTYDFRQQQVRLANIVSTMWPAQVLMWVDPRIAETVSVYRFIQPPLVRGGGTIFMKEMDRNDLSLTMRSQSGFEYDLLGETLRLGASDGTIRVEGTILHANIRRAVLMGGSIALRADVSIDPAKPVFSTEVDVDRVDFPAITKLYFDYEGSEGVVSGTYAFRAPLKDPAWMRGSGSIRVEDGNVFAIPLLGPLSDIIKTVLPGVGYENARLATADFRIAEGIIHSDNLVIEGTGFSLYGEGDIHFLTDEMDMSMRLNARGVPGVFLFPVSKLFEYVSTGTISEPGWRPKIIPRFGGDNP